MPGATISKAKAKSTKAKAKSTKANGKSRKATTVITYTTPAT